MAPVVSASARGSLTRAGKQRVAASMYLKGKSFVGGAILLKRQSDTEHNDFVVLHLLCQGIEVSLKGLLLLKDYDTNIRRLKTPLGHNLSRIASATAEAYGLKPLEASVAKELGDLSNLYSQHLLRYGSGYDILVDPRTIPRNRVLHRLGAAIRLAERKHRMAEGAI